MEDKTESTEILGGLEWGYEIPSLSVKRIKENLRVIGGLDENQVLKGHLFERILGDDSQEFGTAALLLSSRVKNPEAVLGLKKTFLNRLNWEIEQPQTPQAIKKALQDYQEELKNVDWRKEENLWASRKLWEDTIRAKAQKMVDADKEGAGKAVRQYREYFDEVAERKLKL